MSEDRKISERYRELSREEPPRHVDEAILAAARRAAATRPAPLVVPSGRQRWYFPLAAAAIIVLAVAVTMHVEREQPDPEAQVVASTTAPEPAKETMQPQAQEAAKPEEAKPRVFTPDPKPAPSQERKQEAIAPAPELGARRENTPLADLQKAAPAPAAPAAPQRDAVDRASESARADNQVARQRQAAPAASEPAAGALSGAIASYQTMPPDQVLQGIADLRRQGRHDEADKALAEFRKRYPDYKISDEMRAKVERR
jgi:hypothetical protein